MRDRPPASLHIPAALLVVAAALPATTHLARAAQDDQLRILFHGYVNTAPRAGTVRIEEGQLSEITRLPFIRSPAEISPDGTRIAFDTCAKSDRSLNVVALDGSDMKRIVPVYGDSCADLRWSRDSRRLSYGSPLDRQLHVIDLESGIDTPLPYTSPAYGWHAWSPAGDAIVYEVGRGGSRRIDIIDLATWKTRPLVGKARFGACEAWAPDWSPAGDRIAFTSCDKTLYVINVDGTGLTPLASSAYAPRWSPDGSSLLFLSGQTLMRVVPGAGKAMRLGVLPYYGGPFSVGLVAKD